LSVVLAVAAITVLAGPRAHAQQVSQGRTFGGTAYGVSGILEVRRPGVAAGFFESTVGGKTFEGRYLYAGFRTNSSGTLNWFYRTIQGTSTFVGNVVGPDVASRSPARVSIYQNTTDRFYIKINNETGAYPSLYDARFETVLSRMDMPGATALSSTVNGELAYQPGRGNNIFYLWGQPHIPHAPLPACGRFETDSRWRYAFGGMSC